MKEPIKLLGNIAANHATGAERSNIEQVGARPPSGQRGFRCASRLAHGVFHSSRLPSPLRGTFSSTLLNYSQTISFRGACHCAPRPKHRETQHVGYSQVIARMDMQRESRHSFSSSKLRSFEEEN